MFQNIFHALLIPCDRIPSLILLSTAAKKVWLRGNRSFWKNWHRTYILAFSITTKDIAIFLFLFFFLREKECSIRKLYLWWWYGLDVSHQSLYKGVNMWRLIVDVDAKFHDGRLLSFALWQLPSTPPPTPSLSRVAFLFPLGLGRVPQMFHLITHTTTTTTTTTKKTLNFHPQIPALLFNYILTVIYYFGGSPFATCRYISSRRRQRKEKKKNPDRTTRQ